MKEKGSGEESLQSPGTSMPVMLRDPGDGAAGGRVEMLPGEAARVPLQGLDLHEHPHSSVDSWVS